MSNIDVCILPCWNCHDLDFVQAYFKCKRLCLQLNFSNVFLKIWMKWHISQFPTVLKMDIFILFANFGLHLLFVHLSTGNLRKKRIKTNWKKIVDNENPWLLDWSHELVSRVHFLKKVTTFFFLPDPQFEGLTLEKWTEMLDNVELHDPSQLQIAGLVASQFATQAKGQLISEWMSSFEPKNQRKYFCSSALPL